jgi:hypothetical protein
VSPKHMVVIVDGGILSAILQALTRYSANDRQFPVSDRSFFYRAEPGEPAERPHKPRATRRRAPLHGRNACVMRVVIGATHVSHGRTRVQRMRWTGEHGGSPGA